MLKFYFNFKIPQLCLEMKFDDKLKEHFHSGHKKYLRHLSVDCVVFGFHDNELKVLLLKPKYAVDWALPGGFILINEELGKAAHRILKERTGLQKIYLQQFHSFGEPKRSTREINKWFLKNSGIELKDSWMFERFISIGYSALVDFTRVQPTPDILSEKALWYDIRHLPTLILDHKNILSKALENLRLQLNYQPVGYNLLPSAFTMPELQKLYETILERKLDRRNFQRKIISSGILKKLGKVRGGTPHKAPHLYKFDLRKYKTILNSGMGFEL